MTIHLATFEDSIPKETVERGYDFYCEGRVKNAFQINQYEWQAVVQGYDDHRITLIIQNHQITKFKCDCSEAPRGVCKHIVALLYFIREEGQYLHVNDKTGFAEIKDALGYYPPHVLRYIILKYAATSKDFRRFLDEYNKSSK